MYVLAFFSSSCSILKLRLKLVKSYNVLYLDSIYAQISSKISYSFKLTAKSNESKIAFLKACNYYLIFF